MPAYVRPEFRPTLAEAVAPLPRWVRAALLALAGLVVLVLLVLWLRPSDDGVDIVGKGPPTFNFRHPATMRSATPQGQELVRFVRTQHGEVMDSFAVEPLSLPAFAGNVSGILPVLADRELTALKRRFPALEPVQEGKARVNEVVGYTMVFRASRSPRLYGRVVLLPEPVPGSRRGLRLVMLARAGNGVASANDVGAHGADKLPYRSFRFGTEAP